jgi:cyanophycinase-like exopeptidase
MKGTICLQGGAEFGPLGAAMDADLVKLAGNGSVVIAPLASAPGRDYAVTGANGMRHFAEVGAEDVSVAPDARRHHDAAFATVSEADLLVLPGGSPTRLLDALTTTRIGEALRGVLDRGGVVLGASAGAMVLCSWTWLPDDPEQPTVPGLGLVPDVVVLPHWQDRRAGRIDAVRGALPPGISILGLREQSGVIYDGITLAAVGHAASTLLGRTARTIEVGDSVMLDN